MYQRARKLGALIGDLADFVSLTELQLEAYVVGMNALALIDQKNAWIVLPVTGETEHEVGRRPSAHAAPLTVERSQPRKRRKLSRNIPEERYSAGKRDAEIVYLSDMQYEYTLLSARLELIRRDPTLLSSGGWYISPGALCILADCTNSRTGIVAAVYYHAAGPEQLIQPGDGDGSLPQGRHDRSLRTPDSPVSAARSQSGFCTVCNFLNRLPYARC